MAPMPTAEASTSNPFSESSKNVTAATIGGFVGAFVLVLVAAGGMFYWFRRRAKKKRESYSRITSMPWDRSPLFMVPPSQSQLHESYRGMSAAYSFSDPLMDTCTANNISVPRLLPPPRPPPPAFRDTIQSRRQSSGLILPPRPELEATSIEEKDRRHLTIQLKDDTNPTPLSDKEVFRPDSVAQLNYQHYQQHARMALSPAPKPRMVRTNIDGLFPDSPTLAPSPVKTRHPPKIMVQACPESPTSIYSVQDSSQLEQEDDRDSSDSKESDHMQPNYHIARQVPLNSPTSAHTAALPRQFHKTTRYLYPDIPKSPRIPPVPKQVHMSTAYLYAGESPHTPAQSSRSPQERRRRLRKPAPKSPLAGPVSVPPRAQTPTVLSREEQNPRQPSALAMPSQQVRKATSMMDLQLKPGVIDLEPPRVTTSPSSSTLSSGSREVLVGWQRPNQGPQRLSVVTVEPAARFRPPEQTYRTPPPTLAPPRPAPPRPRRVTFDPSISPTSLVAVGQPPRAPQEDTALKPLDPKPATAHVGIRPKTVAFEPSNMETFSVVGPPGSQLGHNEHPLDPSRPQSLGLGTRTKLLIPITDSVQVQEPPKLQVPVATRSPTRFQYPGSPRLTRRSTAAPNNGTSTLVPPRSRPLPHRSSSLNPNSHLINNPGNSINRNTYNNPTINEYSNDKPSSGSPISPESTSPVNTTAVDSKDIQDIRSTKYLSSEFGVAQSGRREGQRMTASPTILLRSAQNSFVNTSSRPSTMTSALPITGIQATNNEDDMTRSASPPRQSTLNPAPHILPQRSYSRPSETRPEPPLKITPNPKEEASSTKTTSDRASSPESPNNFGTAVVTGTLTYSTSTRSKSSRGSKSNTTSTTTNNGASASTSSNSTNSTNSNNNNNNNNSSRRGAHHSIQPPHRLMTPLSRGTNVSPRMGMGLGAGGGWI
ncbi:hypothetical protein V8F20_006086 [Naviculisporaceae sp. PSN 640]